MDLDRPAIFVDGQVRADGSDPERGQVQVLQSLQDLIGEVDRVLTNEELLKLESHPLSPRKVVSRK